MCFKILLAIMVVTTFGCKLRSQQESGVKEVSLGENETTLGFISVKDNYHLIRCENQKAFSKVEKTINPKGFQVLAGCIHVYKDITDEQIDEIKTILMAQVKKDETTDKASLGPAALAGAVMGTFIGLLAEKSVNLCQGAKTACMVASIAGTSALSALIAKGINANISESDVKALLDTEKKKSIFKRDFNRLADTLEEALGDIMGMDNYVTSSN